MGSQCEFKSALVSLQPVQYEPVLKTRTHTHTLHAFAYRTATFCTGASLIYKHTHTHTFTSVCSYRGQDTDIKEQRKIRLETEANAFK